ncbi:hypothetical protein DMB66_30320 [Actinoplanes sp. ATCC 53533]|nr:hypothetical protein DMB66_30320 [Actinoplanes sp. ATCC 53533]
MFPLVPKLTASTGRQFVSVWATKRQIRMPTRCSFRRRIGEGIGDRPPGPSVACLKLFCGVGAGQ